MKRPIVAVTLAVCFVAQPVIANYWNGTRFGGAKFGAYYDSSVATYGYASIFDDARLQWNGPTGGPISTKVAISKVASTAGTPDKYFVGDNFAEPNVAGATVYYRKYTGGVVAPVNLDQDYSYSVVTLYDNNMDDAVYTKAERNAVTAHELGHSLKMAHPAEGSVQHTLPTGQHSVMEQGQAQYNVQPYDKTELKSKWGN